MPLPRLECAVVPAEKLTAYLLSDTHPDGAPKAEFFRGPPVAARFAPKGSSV